MSDKQKHTPGEWVRTTTVVRFRDNYDADAIAVDTALDNPQAQRMEDEPNEGKNIALCFGPDRRENSRLIIAAPDLLAACELTLLRVNANEYPDTVKMLREAVIKAKGENHV